MEAIEQSDTQPKEKFIQVPLSDFDELRLSNEKYSALHERVSFGEYLYLRTDEARKK